MDGSRRWGNLGLAAGAAASAILAAWDVVISAQVYFDNNWRNDFLFYYSATRIGMQSGWSRIYDLDLMQAQLNSMTTGAQVTHVSALARFISPPPLAWLATPFALLPFQPAYGLWVLMLLVALAVCWWLAAPGTGRGRGVFLLAAIAWFPAAYGLQLGQPAMVVGAGLAASYALLKREQDLWAGAALGLLVLKPQLAFLVPPALLVAGRRTAFTSGIGVIAALALLAAVNIGPAGISTFYDRITFAGTRVLVPLTLSAIIPNATITHALQGVIGLWALVLAYMLRRRIELVFVAALLGGLLATPYLHLDDYTMLGLAIWLYLRTPGPSWRWAYLLLLLFAAEGIPVWGAIPVLIGELAAMVFLTLLATTAEFAVPTGSAREPLRAGH